MTQWHVHHGDIFDVEADALICSANVFLTLSGGVGGELLRRYGPPMQQPLEAYLAAADVRHLDRGAVVSVPGTGTPYLQVLHAVAVDGMYDSSPTVVEEVTTKALRQAATSGMRSVTLPALATGYGRLSMAGFMEGLVAAASTPLPLERVTVALRDAGDAATLEAMLARVTGP